MQHRSICSDNNLGDTNVLVMTNIPSQPSLWYMYIHTLQTNSQIHGRIELHTQTLHFGWIITYLVLESIMLAEGSCLIYIFCIRFEGPS